MKLGFWPIAALASAAGEAGSDVLSRGAVLGIAGAVAVVFAACAAALAVQLATRRFHPPVYWITFVLVSAGGTLAADFADRGLHLSQVGVAVAGVCLLILVLGVWRVVEGTLAVEAITTRRREFAYWVVVALTCLAGSALSDLLSDFLDSGPLLGVICWAAVAAVPAACYALFEASAVLCYWTAFTLCRPLGTSVADLLSERVDHGGLGLGSELTSAACLALAAALVVATAIRRRRAHRLEARPAV